MTGLCLLQAQRPEQAAPFLDQALAFDGDNILALWVSGAALVARSLFAPAIARLERAVALSKRGAFLYATLRWALASAGRTEEANAVLAPARQTRAGDDGPAGGVDVGRDRGSDRSMAGDRSCVGR